MSIQTYSNPPNLPQILLEFNENKRWRLLGGIMTAYCNFCNKSFRDKESRDNHLKREHTKLTKENVEYLVYEKGTPAENIARHFNVPVEEIKGIVALEQEKLEKWF